MISSAVLQAYTGSSDVATLTVLEKGTIAWLQRWIPRYLGVSTSLLNILSGPRQLPARLSQSASDERLRRVGLSESIALASISAIEERTDPTATWTALGTVATDYEIVQESPVFLAGRVLRRLTSTWPVGTRNLRITFAHGYAEDAGPDDVTEVALQMISAQLNAKKKGTLAEEELAGADGRARVKYADLGSMAGVNQSKLAALRAPTY